MMHLASLLRYYVGKNLPVGRKDVNKLYKRGRLQKSSIAVFPPYVTIQELRIILGIDYSTCMRTCNVKFSNKKYYWADSLNRQFETINKRKVCIPFEVAAYTCKKFGYSARMLDTEPIWKNDDFEYKHDKIPVVVLLGHINHGKTTLFDKLSRTNHAQLEPGEITQNIRCSTVDFKNIDKSFYGKTCAGFSHSYGDPNGEESIGRKVHGFKLTLIDTPGHQVFSQMRGRSTSIADVALILICAGEGIQSQTEEVLLQADNFQAKIVFVINKIDLDCTNVALLRSELRYACQKLFDDGIVRKNYSDEASEAVPISALYGIGLFDLQMKLLGLIPPDSLPLNPVAHLSTSTYDLHQKYLNFPRRSDLLLDSHVLPTAIGIIIDISKSASRGKTFRILIRHGTIHKGNYFVTGTVFGRVKRMFSADSALDNEVEVVSVGSVVEVCGAGKKGDSAIDDILIVLPKQRAFRLAEYRRRVESLINLQIGGNIPLEVPWQCDNSFEDNYRNQTDIISNFRRQDSLGRRAIEEFGVKDKTSLFTDATVAEFHDKSSVPTLETTEAHSSEHKKFTENESIVVDGSNEIYINDPISDIYNSKKDITYNEPYASKGLGLRKLAKLKSKDQLNKFCSQEDLKISDNETCANETQSTLNIEQNSHCSEGSEEENAHYEENIHQPWYHYSDKETWIKEVEKKNNEIMERWRSKTLQRDLERKRLDVNEKKLFLEAEKLRRFALGEKRITANDEETFLLSDDEDNHPKMVGKESDKFVLPPKNSPVISVILRTKSVGIFDVLMDGIEELQREFNFRIPIVHGGVGSITPNDIVHAEIENEYAYCPVYAFQVGVQPDAVKHALANRIVIKRFDVFTDLLMDIKLRCQNVEALVQHNISVRSMKRHPTKSGL